MRVSVFCAAVITAALSIATAPLSPAQESPAQESLISPEKLAELWQMPADIATRDLLLGPGGAEQAPLANQPFTWIATDEKGFSPGFDVRSADRRQWSVKLGPEAQTEVVSSRILWAIGYHQLPTYYLPRWELQGGPGGHQAPARFRLDLPAVTAVGEWSWSENELAGTQPFRGLIVANILLNSWDWKTDNNRIYEYADGTQPRRRYVVRDLGASLGATSPSRLLGLIPMRGFGQGTRNDIDGFESRGFIKQVKDDGRVEFDFDTLYGDIVDLVRPADVRWTAELLARLSDDQWDAAFRAAEYGPEQRARYIRKIKAKIAEGLAVS